MLRNKPSIEWIALLSMALLPSTSAPLVRAQTQFPQESDIGKKTPGEGPFRVGGGVSPPKVIYAPDPEYSERARKAEYEGTCVLWLIVNTRGMTQNIRVQRSLGMGLDEKAIEAVRSWRFKPAMKDGQPVAVQINVEISFRTDGGTDYGETIRKADAGNVEAQFKLSQVFLVSHDPADESRGLAYLEKAAEQGLPKAQFELGEFLSTRRNDLVSAYVCYSLARQNRYTNSEKRLKELAQKMTPEQLEEAHKRLDSSNPP